MQNFTEFINDLYNKFNTAIDSPIFIGILLGFIVVGFLAYSSSKKRNTLFNKVNDIIEDVSMILLDFTSDILMLFRSLMNFLVAIRYLFFGSLGKQSLYILINYAIVFMSAASFWSTWEGLSELLPGILAGFISFGIQVAELISVLFIINIYEKKMSWKRELYVKFEKIEKINKEKLNDSCSKLVDGNVGGLGTENRESSTPKSSNRKKGLYFVAVLTLILSMFGSVFFSYANLFGKIVYPRIVIDDYINVEGEMAQIQEEFDNEAKEYYAMEIGAMQEDIEIVRRNLIDGMREIIDITDNGESETVISNENIKNAEIILGVWMQQSTVVDIMESSAAELPQEVINQIQNCEVEVNELEAQLDDLEDFLQQPENLFISERDEKGEDKYLQAYEKYRQLFNECIEKMSYLTIRKTDGISDLPVLNGRASNILTLTKYYCEQGDITAGGVESKTESIIIGLKEYEDIYTKIKESKKDEKELLKESEDSLRVHIIDSFERQLGKLYEFPELVRYDPNLEIPDRAKKRADILMKYRLYSGNADVREKAISKLFFQPIKGLTIFTACLALMIDLICILLCFIRGRNEKTLTPQLRRKIIEIFFFKNEIEEKTEKEIFVSKLLLLIGSFMGIFICMVFDLGANWFDYLVAMIIGIFFAFTIGKLIINGKSGVCKFVLDEERMKQIREEYQVLYEVQDEVLREQNIKAFVLKQLENKEIYNQYYKNAIDLLEELSLEPILKIIINADPQAINSQDLNYYFFEGWYLAATNEKKDSRISYNLFLQQLMGVQLLKPVLNKDGEIAGFLFRNELFSTMARIIMERVYPGTIDVYNIEEELKNVEDE